MIKQSMVAFVFLAGGMCRKGQFCPPGSPEPLACTKGYYCDADTLSNVSGICPAGYYCSGGTIEQRPENKTYGDVCPPGHYCEAESSKPTACQAGYFARGEGNSAPEHCQQCKSKNVDFLLFNSM